MEETLQSTPGWEPGNLDSGSRVPHGRLSTSVTVGKATSFSERHSPFLCAEEVELDSLDHAGSSS